MAGGSVDRREVLPLPLLMRPGLRLVFIGYNPGIESGRAGHYYAFRGNVFWRQLNESELVGREVGFMDDALLADEAGIGFTDLCRRPTARADQLTRDELVEGALRLDGELALYQPANAIFCGRGVYDTFAKFALQLAPGALRERVWGAQTDHIGETMSWVIPNSSGLASGLHAKRLELLKQLAAELGAARE